MVVYSFAIHLRRGTYTSLPLSKPPSTISTRSSRRQWRDSETELHHPLLAPHAQSLDAGNIYQEKLDRLALLSSNSETV